MRKYVVVERSRFINSFQFINDETNSLDEIWETISPYKIESEDKKRLSPLIFDNKTDAIKYKNRLQSFYDNDWRNNRKYYRNMVGSVKPKWKVEEYFGDLFR